MAVGIMQQFKIVPQQCRIENDNRSILKYGSALKMYAMKVLWIVPHLTYDFCWIFRSDVVCHSVQLARSHDSMSSTLDYGESLALLQTKNGLST